MISNNEFNQKFVVFTSVISFIVAAVCIPANPHTFAAPGFAQQAISAAPRLDPCRHWADAEWNHTIWLPRAASPYRPQGTSAQTEPL